MDDLTRTVIEFAKLEGGFFHPLSRKKRNLTCGNCQRICVAEVEEPKRRYRIPTESGCVVQAPDGSVEGVLPDEAVRRVAWTPAQSRALYE
jgi:hypothetical protein